MAIQTWRKSTATPSSGSENEGAIPSQSSKEPSMEMLAKLPVAIGVGVAARTTVLVSSCAGVAESSARTAKR